MLPPISVITYVIVDTIQLIRRLDAQGTADQCPPMLRGINDVVMRGRAISDRYLPVSITGSGTLVNYAIYSGGNMHVEGTTTITGDLIVTGKIIQK